MKSFLFAVIIALSTATASAGDTNNIFVVNNHLSGMGTCFDRCISQGQEDLKSVCQDKYNGTIAPTSMAHTTAGNSFIEIGTCVTR